MAKITYPTATFLGAVLSNPRVAYSTIKDILDRLNGITSIDKLIVNTLVEKKTVSAINVTATATAQQISNGAISSTSAAAVTITLPTATQLATELNATRGTTFDFVIDNSAGANTVTVAVGTGIAVATPAITGGATLTVSTANVVGVFRLIFTSDTTAIIARLV